MTYVLGYSGIHGTLDRHRQRYPDADARLSRLVQGLDSAAALLCDGEVIAAAAEERFTGEKGTGDFPVHAIRYCLDAAGVSAGDLGLAAHCFHYQLDPAHAALDPDAAAQHRMLYHPERQVELWQRFAGAVPRLGLEAVLHHEAHARSAFDLSGFDRAVVIVSDGMGETESLTLYDAEGDELRPLVTVPASHSIGVLYSLVTYYLGFQPAMDEYKVMGLASFGEPSRYRGELADLVRLRADGGYLIPLLIEERDRRGQNLHARARARLVELFGAPRPPNGELSQRHMDLAAALQERLNQAMLHVAREARQATGATKLCLAGGVALNCTTNGQLVDSGLFDDVFVQPAAGDDGAAIGAALAASRRIGLAPPRRRMTMPYWGPAYQDAELVAAAAANGGFTVLEFSDDAALARQVAHDLTADQIVAWFQGGMEFGPRALGNRSILADPRDARTRERVNRRIKQREDFRPFAPAVKAEAAGKYFHVSAGLEHIYAHMVVLSRTKEEYVSDLAAITHVDGTARLQTVTRSDNERFWLLLDAMEDLTGYPVVLNTSFNVRGQPIARTPDDAFATALRAGLDALVVGRTYVRPKAPHHRDSQGSTTGSAEV
jgi:carbamoyltransferase